MKSTSFVGSPRLKKWVLLIVSLVAAVIWIRNLTILLPSQETADTALEVREHPLTFEKSSSSLSTTAFRESEGWQDPFVAPFLKAKKISKVGNKKAEKRLLSPQSTPPPWKMAGVVWNAKAPAAVLSSLGGQMRVVVAKGDTIGSYLVVQIEESSVWLRQGSRSWELTLDESADASAP